MNLLRYTLKTIAATRVRFLLTMLSVVIGVAFTVGVFITTDGLRSTFRDLSEDIYRGVDLSVRAETNFGDRDINAPLIDPNLVEIVQSIDGVAAAEGGVTELNVIAIDPEGEPLRSFGPPQIGVAWSADQQLSQLSVWPDGASRIPMKSDEFAMDANTARDNGFEIGQRYRVATPTGTKEFTLVGHFRFGTGKDATIGAQMVAWDVDTALKVLHDGNGFDSIDLRLEPEATSATVSDALTQILPQGVEVVSNEQLVDEQADEFNEIIGFFRNFLLGFAIVILVVSAFIIYNTFTIVVGQRIRELGLLRALGASGAQVSLMVIGEALVVGLAATGVGLGAGVLIAFGLRALFGAFGADLPDTPIMLQDTTIFIACMIGIGVTMVSAIWPALRARKVPPMAALSADVRLSVTDVRPARQLGLMLYGSGMAIIVAGVLAQSTWLTVSAALLSALLLYNGGSRIHPTFGRASVLILGALLLVAAITVNFSTIDILVLLGMGALLVFIGVNLVSPIFAGPAARFLGRLAPMLLILGIPILLLIGFGAILTGRFGVWRRWVNDLITGVGWRIARQNAARSPRRTASTASALMIGLALVSMVTVLGESFKKTLADVLDDAVNSDWLICVASCEDPDASFSPQAANSMAALSELESVTSYRFRFEAARTTTNLEVHDIGSADLSVITRHIDPDIIAGNAQAAGAGQLFLHDDEAAKLDVDVGDSVELEFPGGQTASFEVTTVFADNTVLGSWVIDHADWDRYITGDQDQLIFAITAPGFTATQARAALKTITVDYPQLEVRNQSEFRANQESNIDNFLVVVNVFLGISLIVALMGVTNTLALSVFERTREIGLLRAVGMSRVQTRRSIRWEGAIVSGFGGIMGMMIGIGFGWAAVVVIPDSFIASFAVPWPTLMIYLLLAAGAGLLAGYVPARRASRLNVLEAISYE
ncbi:MAG: ABC transporter permease [Acidimicrobiia bacterium]|nr:ABC transporter permease [Acidimicrobiia bacterium]